MEGGKLSPLHLPHPTPSPICNNIVNLVEKTELEWEKSTKVLNSFFLNIACDAMQSFQRIIYLKN